MNWWILSLLIRIASTVSYEGHVVYRFDISDRETERVVMASLKNSSMHLKAWKVLKNQYADIEMSPKAQIEAKSLIDKFKAKLILDNLSAASPNTPRPNLSRSNFANQVDTFFDDYRSSTEIIDFVSGVTKSKAINIGTTFENRSIPVFEIGRGPKRAMFVAGIHAREWIGPSTLSFISNYLASNDTDAVDLRSKFTFSIVPVLNRDGYEYSRSTDRLWRKNRQVNKNSTCIGTDLNRNFDYKWGKSVGETSDDPCEETYMGDSMLSAPEARALANYAKNLTNLVLFVDMHSYGQNWLSPLGDCENTPDEGLFRAALDVTVDAMSRLHGTKYISGNSCKLYYATTGVSTDYTYKSLGVKHSYTVELRDSRTSIAPYGFLLPKEFIRPTGEETVEGFKALLNFVDTNGGSTFHISQLLIVLAACLAL